jgi:hypothetical protein
MGYYTPEFSQHFANFSPTDADFELHAMCLWVPEAQKKERNGKSWDEMGSDL